MARWLRRLTEQMSELHLLDLRGRVIATLVRLAREAGAGSGAVQLQPMSQSELAALVAGTRGRVNRVLADLAREGLITNDGRRIGVPDVERLAGEVGW